MSKIKELLNFFVDGPIKALSNVIEVVMVGTQLLYAGVVGLLFAIIPLVFCILLNCPQNLTPNIVWSIACIITLIFYSSDSGESFAGEHHSPGIVTALIIGILVYIWTR